MEKNSSNYFSYSIFLFSALLILICSSKNTLGQNLMRRPFLGVQVSEVADSTAKKNKLADQKGGYVVRVIPKSTAESIKLLPGDVIREINGKQISGHLEVVAAAKEFKTGESLTVKI